jgi:paraquat-inducible protein B
MSEHEEQRPRETPPADVPDAEIRERSRISLVWLIPIVAAVIGVWLAYKALSEKGPTITIDFKSAAGLQAGKTKVKYKEVEVGQVESIEIAKDLSHVVVTAELVKGTERVLTENTRFWVVRPRVSGGQVSGLGTLFSGAYIGMDPVTEGPRARHFTGLEVPPVVTAGRPGRLFWLRGSSLGGLDVGSPVHFRQIQVGRVVAYELDPSGEHVTLQVFVDAPHHERVRNTTRFWNESGIDVSMSADGVSVDTTSVVSMLIGGISFDTPGSLGAAAEVPEDHLFPLYPNRQDAREQKYTVKRRYLLYFDQSVRGLIPGSPVELRGIQVGEVVDVKLEMDRDTADFRIPVLIEIEPQRAGLVQETGEMAPRERVKLFVERGFRARLRTANLITGQLAVELDFFPDAPPVEPDFSGPYPQIPTIPTPLQEITSGLARLLDRAGEMPLEDIGKELRGLLVELRELSTSLNRDVTPALVASMENAERTLASAESLVRPGSPVRQDLQRMLRELTEAARALRLLADQLERHPES